jgi:hypothetical protein
MRKFSTLPTAFAVALMTLPAVAAPDVLGTQWESEGCGVLLTFDEYGYDATDIWGETEPDQWGVVIQTKATEVFGFWWIDGETLYLRFDEESVKIPMSSDVFVVDYSINGERRACEFRPAQ